LDVGDIIGLMRLESIKKEIKHENLVLKMIIDNSIEKKMNGHL